MMQMENENNFFSEIALRIKLHIVFCSEHNQDINSDDQHITTQIGTCINMDYVPETEQSIYSSLENSKYIPYSCLLIYINCLNCDCNPTLLDQVVNAIRKNQYLRYKSKLIMTFFDSIYYREQPSILSYNVENLHNTILLEYAIYKMSVFQSAFTYMNAIALQPTSPIKALYLSVISAYIMSMCGAFNHRSSTVADLYFYNINPALAIIVNNYYFTTRKTREGSEYDVMKLILILNAAGIPFILEEDLSNEELLEVLEYLAKENLSAVKSLMFFMMSHGDEKNVIYTKDGQLNIRDDIIKRIQSNESLKTASLLFVFTACRGKVHLLQETLDIIKQINQMPPTENSHLYKNCIVLYSSRELVQSPRKSNGTQFMQNLLRLFEKMIFSQVDIKSIHEELEQSLKKVNYFRKLEKCSELVLNKPENSYKIIKITHGSLEMIDLINKIANNYPTFKRSHNYGTNDQRQLSAMFCICGSVNNTSVTTKFSQLLPNLNDDNCFMIE